MSQKMTRRDFTRAGAAATLGMTAAQYSRAQGANERVQLGKDMRPGEGFSGRIFVLEKRTLKGHHLRIAALPDLR